MSEPAVSQGYAGEKRGPKPRGALRDLTDLLAILGRAHRRQYAMAANVMGDIYDAHRILEEAVADVLGARCELCNAITDGRLDGRQMICPCCRRKRELTRARPGGEVLIVEGGAA